MIVQTTKTKKKQIQRSLNTKHTKEKQVEKQYCAPSFVSNFHQLIQVCFLTCICVKFQYSFCFLLFSLKDS